MGECVRETLCMSCYHREVCQYKALFLEAQKEIDDAYINEETGPARQIVYIRDIPFLKPVELKCTYYIRKEISIPTLREGVGL